MFGAMKASVLLGTTTLAFAFGAVSALADVTPEEVWENWKASSEQGGTVITSESEARDGDTLVITGVGITGADETAGVTEGKIGEIRLKDLGNGTVEITQSESYSLVSTIPAVEGVEPPLAQTVQIDIKAPGAVTLVSGTVEAMSFDVSLPTFDASVVSPDDSADPLNVQISAVNVAGVYLVEGTAPLTVSGSFGADSMAIAFKGKDPEAGSDVDLTAAIGAIETTFDAIILDDAEMEDMGAALAAGFEFHFDTAYGATSFAVNVTEAGSPISVSGGVNEGSVTIGMDSEAFTYQTGSKGLNVAVSGAEIPFPEVKLALGESGFGLMMPTGPTEAPGEFSILAKLVDLSISDEIWGMLDPGAALSHDPATVIIDGKGTAQLTSSLFDEGAMKADAPPGQLLSFDLTQLLARIAGAELTGTGAFTFDNTDLETFGGMPVPTGKIDLKVTGANTLMDTLIAMGLLSEDDAMGARVMMSMFANPGPGADELTSVLEFKDKGFYANGQRLQ